MEWLREDLPGARVLDLFAGTGALGLEALSRGAVSADFVENGAEALHALKANRAKLRVTGRTRLFKMDGFRFLEGLKAMAYDVTFADPPYTSGAAARLVRLWLARPFSSILSVEHPRTAILPGGGRRRVLEDSCVTVLRVGKGPASPRPSATG
jgi:16S rRNA (guanine966-N2)-methyltransferase